MEIWMTHRLIPQIWNPAQTDDSSEDMIDPNEELVPIDEAPGMSADGNVEGIE